MRTVIATVVFLLCVTGPITAQTVPVEREEAMISSGDRGVMLYVRNKHPRGMKRFDSDHVVLYVHGASYPSETTFDLPLNGISWMDYIAERGYDVWLVDVRGYGRSTRPAEMDQPPESHPPIVRTPVAVADVAHAVDYICARRGISKVDLIGWSWGTTIMARYASENDGKVNKLVLYAPEWLVAKDDATQPPKTTALGAYRLVSISSAKERWFKGVPPEKAADLIPKGWFEQWATATFATDPVGSKQSPPSLRRPNGVTADSLDYWSQGRPLYDPNKITVPTLIAHAEWDGDLPTYMDDALYKLLTHVPYKRFVQIGEGTHFVFMEKNRMQLFEEVQLFLDEHYVAGA